MKGAANAGISEGEIDAISIDMDPSSSPANTATSIGSREFCARIDVNGVQDADEDGVDTLELDVTVGPEGIPAEHPMMGFQAGILYDPSAVHVVDSDVHLLLSAIEGSDPFDASHPLPNTDGKFFASALDIGTPITDVAEHGAGVLARISIKANDSAASGIHHLLIRDESYTVDPQNEAFLPVVLNHGVVAIDTECPAEQPEPSFPATPSPTPTPTPGQGDPTPPKGSPVLETGTPTPTMEPFPTPTATPFPTPTPEGGSDEDSGIGGSPVELPKTGGPAGGGGIGLVFAAIGAAFAGGASALVFSGMVARRRE